MHSILDYLEESALRYPNRIAFADPDAEISYKDLKDTAGRIGTALAREVPVPGPHPVPVLMPKSVRAVSVFLGAVCAGGFYSMLDEKQPDTRLRAILDTLRSDVLVTDRENEQKARSLAAPGQKVLFYEDLAKAEADPVLLTEIRRRAADVDPLYVNFTSGSTGVPKGVAVSHRSVIDFIDCFTELFHISSRDVIGNQAPFDFDVSVKDIYSTLKTGATMQIIPQRFFSIPTELLDFLIDRSVTTLIWAVSALTIVSKLHGFEYRVPKKIRRVIFSGEVMPVRHLNIWRDALPEAEFINVYGPTEITCNCTYYRIARDFSIEESIPIGIPFPNEKVFLLDEEDHLVDRPGAEGEICVGGTALALGYYRNRAATAAAFVQNPLNDRYLEMIYRTGDLAVYLEDGNLAFTGRKDHQIKHMGHRIELGEIEQAMHGIPEVERCCCLFLKEKITAFYTGEIDRKALIPLLKSRIPDYMVPNRFVRMEALPYTKNGKIDRQALSAM